MGIEKASEVILVGDGAPWIWERISKFLEKTGGSGLKITEILDWTHAKQNLQKALDSLPKKKAKQADFGHFKELLFEGNISAIVNEVKTIFKMRSSSNIRKKLGLDHKLGIIRIPNMYHIQLSVITDFIFRPQKIGLKWPML